MNIDSLPEKISVFPLLNVIFFPKTILPLNIFEKRYLQMVNDSFKQDKYFGIVQPRTEGEKPELFKIGCLGKIVNFNETEDNRIIINLSGIIRFKIKNEIKNKKLYREVIANYQGFEEDLKNIKKDINYNEIKKISNKIKMLFKKKGYLINWENLEILNFTQLIDTFSMISPLSTEEKQSLIEAKNLSQRIEILNNITDLYLLDNFDNKTIQ